MIVAIDGPAASGKGTLARRLAQHYRLPHLDTGLLYRATARALIDADCRLDGISAVVEAARGLALTEFDEAVLRGREMGEAASVVAALPEVRAALVAAQRTFAGRPGGAVLDGRDIGTVICPDASIKIFVTASPETRAARRALELRGRGEPSDYASVLADILRRDERDSARATAPLKPAADAAILDTTDLDVEAAFRAALDMIETRLGGHDGAKRRDGRRARASFP
ncbi:MAG: (d)CMP kinase [Beijerinckiaceae bacterium]